MNNPVLRTAVLIALAAPFGIAQAAPSNSAYLTDAQTTYVQDKTSDSIGGVNMITCIMSSMRPDALVNQGPYVALVDQNKCDSSKSGVATSSAGAGAAQAPNYMHAVVDSTRASNSDPMITKAWITFNEEDKAMIVYVHISATEAPSTSNPYGAFRIDYCGKLNGGDDCNLNGYMQGGSGALTYYEEDSHESEAEITALELTSVGTTTGSGSLFLSEARDGQTESSGYDFAYNSQLFLRQDTSGNTLCFSRDASDPATGMSVNQYGLYDADTGAQIQRTSGFPIQYTVAGTQYQGYVGYYGLSLPPSAPTPADGSTVQKPSYTKGAASSTAFTVVTNGGRLTRYTKQSRTLQSIDQIHFNAYINEAASFGLPDPGTNYELYWDDASGQFKAVGELRCSPDGCQTTSFDHLISLDASLWVSMGGVQGYSQSLGGDLFVNLANQSGAINSSTIAVSYYVQDLVYPDDSSAPASLYCANNCPTAGSLHAFLQGQNTVSPYAAGSFNNFQPVTAAGLTTYSLSGAVLSGSDGMPVVDTASADYANQQQYQSGVMSGRLFANLSDAQCGTANNLPTYCDYQVNSASVYYTWTTGPNTFSQFAALKDATGAYVHFDAPLNVNFAVPNETRYGSYAGKSLVLQYGDFGDLWGIPGSCVSPDDNSPESCGNQGARFVSQFIIPYDPSASPHVGAVTSTSNGVTTSYLVKWLQREIRFAVKDGSVCSTAQLQAPTGVQLPTAALLDDPSSSSSALYLGTEPTVTASPRVIQGEVKY